MFNQKSNDKECAKVKRFVLNTKKVLILTENIAELVDTFNADEYVSSFFIKSWYFWRWILFHLGFYIEDCDATDYWFIFIVNYEKMNKNLKIELGFLYMNCYSRQ
jgi:hypothetical protein